MATLRTSYWNKLISTWHSTIIRAIIKNYIQFETLNMMSALWNKMKKIPPPAMMDLRQSMRRLLRLIKLLVHSNAAHKLHVVFWTHVIACSSSRHAKRNLFTSEEQWCLFLISWYTKCTWIIKKMDAVTLFIIYCNSLYLHRHTIMKVETYTNACSVEIFVEFFWKLLKSLLSKVSRSFFV